MKSQVAIPTKPSLHDCRGFLGLLLVGSCLLTAAHSSLAEIFLTVEQAQSLCFPDSTRFESKSVKLTKDQVKTISRATKVKFGKAPLRYVEAYRKNKLAGILILDSVLGKHEWIDYAVALSPKGEVQQVEILTYRERYGGEVRTKDWRRQFTGKTAQAPLKLNDDIYNISGATISCRNVTDGVRRVVATFQHVLLPLLMDNP